MNNPILMDADPLSAYEAQYEWPGQVRVPLPGHLYPHTTHAQETEHGVQYNYQSGQPQPYQQTHYQSETTHPNYNLPQDTNHQPVPSTSQQLNQSQLTNQLTTLNQLQPANEQFQPTDQIETTNQLQPKTSETPTNQQQPEQQQYPEEEDIKPDIKELEANLKKSNRRSKAKGRVSSYWNKIITDKDFAFYGCSLCEIPFKDIQSLDKHMLMHSNRITTYEIRKINVENRKMLKKAQKRKKKEEKIKKEMEIKPEDGYIGTDKVADVNNETGQESTEKSTVKQKKKPKTLEDYDKKSPAYLRAVNKDKFIHAYKCFGCDKLFALSYYLRLHVRSHTGEKPYTCQTCGQSFITASKMNRHIKRIHLATRHQCRICYKVFTRFELLVKHFDTKHPEQKLDGEVYDYNALLPYIKELEEQLKGKIDKEKGEMKKENKWDLPVDVESALQNAADKLKIKEEFAAKSEVKPKINDWFDVEFVEGDKDQKGFDTGANAVDETKVYVECKREVDEDDEQNGDVNDDHYFGDDHGYQNDDDDVYKAEDQDTDTDEDYEPTETWVLPHAPPVKTRKKNKTKRIVKREDTDQSGDATVKSESGDGEKVESANDGERVESANEGEIEGKTNNRKWEQPTRCPLCDKYISKMKNLEGHINTHTDKKPYVCRECDRKYCTPAALNKHLRSAHPNAPPLRKKRLRKKKESKRVKKVKLQGESRDVKNEEKDKENKSVVEIAVADKIKEDPTSEEDYFPSDTWVRPPSPLPEPTGPSVRRDKVCACPVCNKIVSSKTYLAVHMRTHTGEKPFSCYVCERRFITASKMRRHVLTHDETWEVKKIKAGSDEEGTEQELDKKKAKIAAKRAFFDAKKQRKVGPWTYICEFCNKRFLHNVTLQVHLKSHNLDENMKCYYCLEEFANGELLKSHKDTHTPPKMYQCQFCKKQFGKKGPMMTHRKRCGNMSNSEGKVLTCDICSKRFQCASRLQRHMASHTASMYTLKYECPVCAHMFNTRYHIQMHLRSHIKEGIIQEENRAAVLAMVLQNARKIPKPNTVIRGPLPNETPDAGERSRICNICGEIFDHFYFLEEHLKLHANKISLADLEDDGGEKKHVCAVCSKSFKLPYYLKLHSFTHTKEKPFICQECGKGFITRGKLKRHLETHQGLKKYQCHICYKFFTRTSYLRIHIRTIHGPQEYNLGVPIGLHSLPVSS